MLNDLGTRRSGATENPKRVPFVPQGKAATGTLRPDESKLASDARRRNRERATGKGTALRVVQGEEFGRAWGRGLAGEGSFGSLWSLPSCLRAGRTTIAGRMVGFQ